MSLMIGLLESIIEMVASTTQLLVLVVGMAALSIGSMIGTSGLMAGDSALAICAGTSLARDDTSTTNVGGPVAEA